MTFLLTLKYALRNKRYVMFTVFPPLAWYLLLAKSLPLAPEATVLYCLMIGISGNCLTTFGKRIASEKRYYALQQRITPYGRWHYVRDQVGLQMVSNAVICLLPLGIGLSCGWLHITGTLLLGLAMLAVLAVLWSIVGFVLGWALSVAVLDMISFPMMLVLIALMIPVSQTSSAWLVVTIRWVQTVFPVHYLLVILSDGGNYRLWCQFVLTSVGSVLPFGLWFSYRTRRQKR